MNPSALPLGVISPSGQYIANAIQREDNMEMLFVIDCTSHDGKKSAFAITSSYLRERYISIINDLAAQDYLNGVEGSIPPAQRIYIAVKRDDATIYYNPSGPDEMPCWHIYGHRSEIQNISGLISCEEVPPEDDMQWIALQAVARVMYSRVFDDMKDYSFSDGPAEIVTLNCLSVDCATHLSCIVHVGFSARFFLKESKGIEEVMT